MGKGSDVDDKGYKILGENKTLEMDSVLNTISEGIKVLLTYIVVL